MLGCPKKNTDTFFPKDFHYDEMILTTINGVPTIFIYDERGNYRKLTKEDYFDLYEKVKK